MKKFYLLILVLLSFNLAHAQVYRILAPDLNMVYISDQLSFMAPYNVQAFTNAMNFHKKHWDWQPSEDIAIMLNDFDDEGNGGALTIPWNYVTLMVSPFSFDFDVVPSNERMQWLMCHELTHIAVNDKGTTGDEAWRTVFSGKVMPDNKNPLSMVYSYLTSPRWYSPRWFQEGIAIFMETWMSGGIGRTNGAYDEMVFRTMVLDSSYFYRVVGLETEGTSIDFQVGVNSYLYGTRFISYIANKYGVDKLMQLFNRSDSSKKFYASQFHNVYGLSVDDAWEDWIEFEKDFQWENINKIREYPITKPRYITDEALGSASPAFFDPETNKIYAAINHPGDFARISSIDLSTGEMDRIDDVITPKLRYVTQITADIEHDLIIASKWNNNWRGTKSINYITGEEKNLFNNDRTRLGHFAINPVDRSLWAVQVISGRTAIVRAEYPYDEYMRIYSIPFGDSFFSLNVSPDGEHLIGTKSDPTGRQQIISYNIKDFLNGKTDHRVVYEFEDNSASDFRFSLDGKYIYGTSYYTGVSNIFRIEFETGEMTAVTNAERGFFRPVDLGGDSLFAWEYAPKGLIPCIIKKQEINDINAIEYLGQKIFEKNPQLADWALPPPSAVDIDSVIIEEDDYNSFSNLALASIYPIVEGYKEFPAYGLNFKIMDRLAVNHLSLNASYSPNPLIPEKQRLHLNLDYRYWFWNFKASWNRADFYDLFGPTKVSRAGYMLYGSYHDYFVYMKSPMEFDYTITAAMYGDLDALPAYQNIDVKVNKLYAAQAEVHYSMLRKSLGGIEKEAGIDTRLIVDGSYVADEFFPRGMVTLDYGFLLPLRNSSLWLRSSAGIGSSNRESVFSNFYFGGFGNNYLDHRNQKQYRNAESFAGLEINEVTANKFGKIMMELNLTPIRFRHLGFLYLYATHADLSLFGSALMTDPDNDKYNRAIYNAGLQIDMEVVFFSLLKTTLSFGYGTAFEDGRKPQDQFMISLKLM
jgi:hypothetical protein